jgi:hypothetical protein
MATGLPDWTQSVSTSVDVTSTVVVTASDSPTFDQVTVTGAATAIGAARANRSGITVYNPVGSGGTVYLGDHTVTAATGDILEPGESVTYGSPIAWYGITTGGSVLVSYEDE